MHGHTGARAHTRAGAGGGTNNSPLHVMLISIRILEPKTIEDSNRVRWTVEVKYGDLNLLQFKKKRETRVWGKK